MPRIVCSSRGRSSRIELVAERLHEGVERVARDIAGAPQLVHQVLARHDAAGPPHQAFEQVVFGSGQRQHGLSAHGGVTGDVNAADPRPDRLSSRAMGGRRPSARSRASRTAKANGLVR